ncbi:MAG TPA: Cthe_2314 family HEPN domain-containing protein [Phycisphaerae bacterium]|nr:Cthe_2314 family HEPN domain-containing protein [Phycisphaerae bacterium]
MTVFERIDSTAEKANVHIAQKTRRMKVTLYAEGLKAKIRQADFALGRLLELANLTDSVQQSTDAAPDAILHEVYFYSDTFWAFSYSALDVLAQLTNQIMRFGITEREVSFKSLLNHLNGIASPLRHKFQSCAQSHAFKNLDDYRNCSTHRRQICIVEKTTVETQTAGYVSTTAPPMATVVRLLCDNPLALTPKYRQKRQVPGYMLDTQDKIICRIQSILRDLKPVR